MFVLAGHGLNNAGVDNSVTVRSHLSLVAPLKVIHVGSLVPEHELEDAFKGEGQCEEKQHLAYRFPWEKGRKSQDRGKNYRIYLRSGYLQPAKKGKER